MDRIETPRSCPAHSADAVSTGKEVQEAREQHSGSKTSTIAARTTLLREFVEFLENSMPEIVNTLIGTVGMLIIIGRLNLNVFWACLALLGLVLIVYWATSDRNYRLNAGCNDELERQVTVLDSGRNFETAGHFNVLMRWNRRLSDLEAVNYIAIWLGVIALLIYAPRTACRDRPRSLYQSIRAIRHLLDRGLDRSPARRRG